MGAKKENAKEKKKISLTSKIFIAPEWFFIIWFRMVILKMM